MLTRCNFGEIPSILKTGENLNSIFYPTGQEQYKDISIEVNNGIKVTISQSVLLM
jgi:hypothetical protein